MKKSSLYDKALAVVTHSLNFKGIEQQSHECNEYASGWMESSRKIVESNPFIEREFQALWAESCQVDLLAVQCHTCNGFGSLQSNFFPVGNRSGRVLMNLKLAIQCPDCHGNGVPRDLFDPVLKFKFKVIRERKETNERNNETAN